MAIFNPEVHLSKVDKQLLGLLVHLVLETENSSGKNTNIPERWIVLSQQQYAELIPLLEQYISQSKIQQAHTFVEIIGGLQEGEEENAREIYLSLRKRHGRSRAMSSMHWSNFQMRLGLRWRLTRASFSERMKFKYFVEMERRLLNWLKVHPRVAELILEYIQANEENVEDIRNGLKKIQQGHLTNLVRDLIQHQTEINIVNEFERPISQQRLISIVTLVADSSTLFTTRDWSVCGVISTMAAATICSITPE